MVAFFQHVHYLLRHKYYVFREGRKRKVGIWQLLIHDLSKFLPSEFIPYTAHFFRNPGNSDWNLGKGSSTYPAFQRAFRLHVLRNAHHWEYWCAWDMDRGYHSPQKIPEKYFREMLADWDGTGYSKIGRNNTKEFYLHNLQRISLHPKTRERVEKELGVTLSDLVGER